MLTMNVAHGQWPGSGAVSVASAARASGSDRAAGENRGQLAIVVCHADPCHLAQTTG